MKVVKPDDEPLEELCDECYEPFTSGYMVYTGGLMDNLPVVRFLCPGCYEAQLTELTRLL